MDDTAGLDPSILREYDIRGIVTRDLGPHQVRLIGRAFGTMAVARGERRVAVAYDGRLSSPELERAVVEGLTGCGLEVVRLGLGPTPMLYFGLRFLDIGAGIMVTGSHNPSDYNGLKMLLGQRPLTADRVREIGKLAGAGAFARGDGTARDIDVRSSYVDRLVAEFRPGRRLLVAWDSGNGAAGDVIARLSSRLPELGHILLNADIDGTFPAHHPDPAIAGNLAQLRQAVRQTGCDLGIAFDGDGDRIGVVDGAGEILWPD